MKRKRVAMVYDPDWRTFLPARQWRLNQEWRRLAAALAVIAELGAKNAH